MKTQHCQALNRTIPLEIMKTQLIADMGFGET